MALETHQYTSIPRNVLAVRVTSQNMREVAAWCNGEINNTKPDGSRGPRHIRLELPSAKDERQKKAYPGDWVVHNEKGFRIFIDKAFHMNFVQIDGVESVFHETGIPAKQAAKKKTPKKKTPPKMRPINPVMAAAMKAAQEKLGATEIVQGSHEGDALWGAVTTVVSDLDPKDRAIENAMLEEGIDRGEMAQILENTIQENPEPVGTPEVRTIENSLDRLTGAPATVYTPPEDLVPIGTEINIEGALMERANERQDPADAKKVDAAVETTPQDPPAEPAPTNPTTNAVEVTPEAPTVG